MADNEVTLCPPEEMLHRFLDGELNLAEREAFETHLAQCQTCQADLAELQTLFTELASIEAVAAPPELVSQVMTRLPAAHPAPRRVSMGQGLLAGQILQNLSEAHSRSPLIRLAARNLTNSERTPESDLLSYLLFDGEFLAPLADLGFADARAREEELVAFFSD